MIVAKHILLAAVLTHSLLGAVASASETEPDLVRSCLALPAGSDGRGLCELYIQGYIAGAVATDAANAQELAGTSSDFMQRALQTRAGSRESASAPAEFLHFCLPARLEPDAVIPRLGKHLPKTIEDMGQINSALYGALRLEYPCEKPGG